MDFPVNDAIIAIIFTALGGFLTKLLDFLRQQTKDKIAAEDTTDRKILAGYELTITKLDQRVVALDGAYEAIRREHLDCIRVQSELRAELIILKQKLGLSDAK